MNFYLNYKEPNYWGPIYWNVLHNFAKKIDSLNNLKLKYKFLYILNNLQTIIPCDECSSTYQKTLRKAQYILKIKNENSFSKLVYYIHLCVNIKKINDDSSNLDKFIDNLNFSSNLETIYKTMFPNNVYFGPNVLNELKPIDFDRFTTYFQKFTSQQFVHLHVYTLMEELFHILYP